jgi:acyl carrier protein
MHVLSKGVDGCRAAREAVAVCGQAPTLGKGPGDRRRAVASGTGVRIEFDHVGTASGSRRAWCTNPRPEGKFMMKDEYRQFLFDSLKEMNYSTDGIDENTPLGPSGADLESLALAELAVRVEDRFGVRFEDEEAEKLATMTVGEFFAAVDARLQSAPSGH